MKKQQYALLFGFIQVRSFIFYLTFCKLALNKCSFSNFQNLVQIMGEFLLLLLQKKGIEQ